MPVTVTIADSDFFGNFAQASGINARGGAIFANNDADITITRTTIEANQALPPATPNASVNSLGGGISAGTKTLTIRDSEITANVADRHTALHLFNDASARQSFAERFVVQVINSTLSGNSTPQHSTVLAYANTDLKFSNSTIVGNRSEQNRTAGIYLGTGATVPATASNALAPTLTLESSILWNPLGRADIGKDGTTVAGAVAVTANNSMVGRLCDIPECNPGAITLAGTGNQVGVDPLLGPLAANGSNTQTRLPQLGSPSIDKGNNALSLANDQRGAGFPRTIGTLTDAGATEYAFPAQCVGFGDITGNSAFCPSAAWMKDRLVTTGCGDGSNYCPDSDVIRLAMAAFMQRFGLPLSGLAFHKTQTSGLLDFSTAPVICQSDAIPATTAPRRAGCSMPSSRGWPGRTASAGAVPHVQRGRRDDVDPLAPALHDPRHIQSQPVAQPSSDRALQRRGEQGAALWPENGPAGCELLRGPGQRVPVARADG